MVGFQFYQYIFIGAHTHKDWRKEERLEKQRKEKPKAERGEKNKTEERERGREEGREAGRGPAVFFLLRTFTTSQGVQRGNKARIPGWGTSGTQPRGVARGSSQVPGPPSPPASIPTPAISCPATYFCSTPPGRAPAGTAGRHPHPWAWWQRPLERSALTSTRPCQHPNQPATRLEPTDRPVPPSPAPSHRRDAPPCGGGGGDGPAQRGGRDSQGRSRWDPWGVRWLR